MFSEIDNIIFPDGCEVIQTTSQQFVYPIFKNGQSSLYDSVPKKNWKIITAEQIHNIEKPITIFLRDPKKRFISGVNTYLQHLERDTPGLDLDTVMFFVDKYLFLNRHYCPQFFWLLNLARYTNPTVSFEFQNFEDINKLTDIHSKAGVTPIAEKVQQRIDAFDWRSLELYFFLDQLVMEQIGNKITFQELTNHIQTNHPEIYNLIFKKSIDLIHVLSKT